MKKIEKLTAAQTAKLSDYAKRWTEIGLSTTPADRPRAEAAIIEMYRVAGLPAPRIVWCGSPMAQGLTRAIILDQKLLKNIGKSVWASVGDSVGASVGNSVWDSVRASVWASVGASVGDSVWASVGDSVRASVGDSVWDSVGDSVRASVWDSVWDSVRASVWASVGASVGASVRASVRDSVWDSVRASVRASVYGQHDANWLAFYKFFRDECGLKGQTEKLNGLTELCESAGWALPHQSICWVSERHCLVARDDRGRLHSLTGPALLYPDGWGVYAVHGTRIPETWITDPKSLTAKAALTWPNVEQRRAACEILTWKRVLEELNCITIDEDSDPEIGKLVQANIPDIGKEKFLIVQCGTKRTFALPVPPTMKTALEANCWTYNVEPNVLKLLEVRT